MAMTPVAVIGGSSSTLQTTTYDVMPSRRVILLGASNLVLSFPTIVATARATWGEPIEFMAAMGHGRSYGKDTSVFGRKISGIFPCALWQDLQNRPPMPTTALVTDIGNDLLYGVTPDQLLGMGRAMPRSTGGSERVDGRHAIADREPRTTGRSAISILSTDTFSAQPAHVGRRESDGSVVERSAHRDWANREKYR